MASKSGPDIIEDGLVLCLDAASKRSYPGTGTVWTDLTGSNSGTLTNGPTFDAGNGGGIVFDGSDDYVDLGSPSSLAVGQSDFTWNVWVKTGSSLSGYKMILSCNVYYCYLSTYDSQFTFDTSVNGTNRFGSISTNTWYNVTVARSGTTAYCYIDSSLINTTSESRSIGGQFNVGRWAYNGSLPYNSRISNVSIYNRALTADEIRRNYLSTKERFA